MKIELNTIEEFEGLLNTVDVETTNEIFTALDEMNGTHISRTQLVYWQKLSEFKKLDLFKPITIYTERFLVSRLEPLAVKLVQPKEYNIIQRIVKRLFKV